MSDWTTEAQERWMHIPADKQELILDRIWCPHCGELRRTELEGGVIVAGDLVLAGHCTVCGHRTVRLLEHEPHPISVLADQTFQPGESVIWLKRLPGGPYVVPLPATIIAITPKRIKIMANDDSELVTRFVPSESLQRLA